MAAASSEINLTEEIIVEDTDSDIVAKQKVELKRLLELYGGIDSVCPSETPEKKRKLESDTDPPHFGSLQAYD
jgi:hypothetical protein